MSTDVPAGQWTVDTLRANVDQQFAAIYRLLEERKLTSDEAGRVALAAQQTAMRTALEAAEKAVTTALTSAEKAVNKAEVAADKRFDAVNEFRNQLSDQATTFMPRAEAQVSFNALDAKLSEHVTRANEAFKEINATLSTLGGNQTGVDRQRVDMARLISIAVSVLAAVVAVYAVLKP